MRFDIARMNVKKHIADAMTVTGYVYGGISVCQHHYIPAAALIIAGMAGQYLHDVWR